MVVDVSSCRTLEEVEGELWPYLSSPTPRAPHAGVASNADKCPDVERISESAAVAIADEAAADVAVTAPLLALLRLLLLLLTLRLPAQLLLLQCTRVEKQHYNRAILGGGPGLSRTPVLLPLKQVTT